MIKLILLFLISFNLFAGTMPNNDYRVGKGSSTDDKGFTFNTGDGAANPTMKVNDLKTLIYSDNKVQIGDGASVNDKEIVLDPSSNASLKWEGSDNYVEIRAPKFRVGNGVDEDIIYEFDTGLGVNNPKIKYDSAKGKFRQSIAGSDKDLGTGGGAGGGENYNNAFSSDNNPDAEDGISGWTASGGTFGVVSNAAGSPLGDQSFTWTPSAQNDYVESSVLNFDRDIFKGRECEARIEYIGGDENLSLQVVNGNNVVISEEVIPAHSVWGQESIFFLCPSQADITGDSELGNLRYRIANTGASAAPLIKWDKSYNGTLRGLTEVTMPDVFAARLHNNGSVAAIFGTNADFLNSATRTGTGNIAIDYSKLGLANIPSIVVTQSSAVAYAVYCSARNSTTTSASLECVDNTGTPRDEDVNIVLTKQGSDAKQTIQIYKSIPKLAQNESIFGADISSTLSISSENVDFLSGCVSNGTGDKTCTFSVSFSQAPTVRAAMRDGAGDCRESRVSNVSTTSFRYQTFNSGGAVNDCAVSVSVIRAGSDYRTGRTQNISLVGIAVNSYAETSQKQVKVEACKVLNNGTASTGNVLCDNWIQSVTRTALGRVTVDFTGAFDGVPTCTLGVDYSQDGNGQGENCIFLTHTNANSASVICLDSATVSDKDMGFDIHCIGRK